MKLTKFPRLKRAIENLSPLIFANKLQSLDEDLTQRGLLLDSQNTVFTQDGIFYIEPESGIATKVVAYVGDFAAQLSKAQKANLAREGYDDSQSIMKFHHYHLMRCNTVSLAEREQWNEPYRISRRTSGKFFYRIVSEVDSETDTTDTPEVYQEIENQQLYVCTNCLYKATSLLVDAYGETQETFDLKMFFDVNLMQSWNSQGVLSKDYGFTKDMYPADWLEICRIRMEQADYQCQYCFEDLSSKLLQRYLYIHPTDHVQGKDGYVKLDCICIACLADIIELSHFKEHPEFREYCILRDKFHSANNAD